MYSFIHLFFHSFNKRVAYKCPARRSPGCLAHSELAASPLLRLQRRRRQWPGPGGGRQWGGVPGQGSHQGDHPPPGLATLPASDTGGSILSAGMKGQENALGAEGVRRPEQAPPPPLILQRALVTAGQCDRGTGGRRSPGLHACSCPPRPAFQKAPSEAPLQNVPSPAPEAPGR